MKISCLALTFLMLSIIVAASKADAQTSYNRQWPGFRGPMARGYLDDSKTATSWNVQQSKNINWKTAIPGLGHSSPVIWDDYLFVTTASSEKKNESLKVGLYGDGDMANDSAVHEFKVYCLDKKTGKLIWEKVAHKGIPKSKRHTKASQANCTPATNGEYLVVNFGSEGLFCSGLAGTGFGSFLPNKRSKRFIWKILGLIQEQA